MIEIVDRNLFTSECQTLVNTVNCKGVMGKGIALEFRLRFPTMFKEYERRCKNGDIRIGHPCLYQENDLLSSTPWILNFPTKDHWKYPSKEAYLHEGLKWFTDRHKGLGVESIAFPLLGAENGGLSTERSLAIMKEHLDRIEIPVHVHMYNPAWTDDLHPILKRLTEAGVDVGAESGLNSAQWASIQLAIEKTNTVGQLSACKGVGEKALEKLIRYLYSDIARRKPIGVTIDLNEHAVLQCTGNVAQTLANVLSPFTSDKGLPIRVRYETDRARGTISLSSASWRILPENQVLEIVRRKLGEAKVNVDLAGDADLAIESPSGSEGVCDPQTLHLDVSRPR